MKQVAVRSCYSSIPMPTISVSRPHDRFVNSDIKSMAVSLISQTEDIQDEEPRASVRRASLLRASSHLLNAFAELETLSSELPRF